MGTAHWNYFLAIEDDIERLSRYIEISNENFRTYSIELARLLMTATQESDVLLKQICAQGGDKASTIKGYCEYFRNNHGKLCDIEVGMPKFGLEFKPFACWLIGKTPTWWAANNSVKHSRHTHFKDACLEHALTSVAGLFLCNIFFHCLCQGPPRKNSLFPDSRLFSVPMNMKAGNPFAPNHGYRLP